MLALALALFLDCKPVGAPNFNAKGNTKRGLTLEVREYGMTLRENGSEVWNAPQAWYKVLFADDDSWVAMLGPYGNSSVFFAPTQKGTRPLVVDVLGALTEAERKRVEVTDCGPMWMRAWQSSPKGLQLTVNQGKAPALVFVIGPTGTLTREPK